MNRIALPALACLTLGLAPFAPEPHVVGKLRWVLGGGHGMSGLDWFDLFFHLAPWLWLVVELARMAIGRSQHKPAWQRMALLLALAGAVACALWALSPR